MLRIVGSITLTVALLAVACSRTATTSHPPDAAAQSGTGGSQVSSGGTGAVSPGTGGAFASGGVKGTGGSVGSGGHTDGGTPGAGGTARDAASGDQGTAGDTGAMADAADGCAPGYPVGSSRPAGDSCNVCACVAGGVWACTQRDCINLDVAGADKPVDGAGQARDAAPDKGSLETASPACSAATTEEACKARAGCHAVFIDGGLCGCMTPGCCMTFSFCADGARADCNGPATCKMMPPDCGDGYDVAYEASCYEGCVRSEACAL